MVFFLEGLNCFALKQSSVQLKLSTLLLQHGVVQGGEAVVPL